jgi:hypothetical protein
MISTRARTRENPPTCCSLEVASSIVAPGKENVVVVAALEWLVKWDGLTHELLFDLSETVETRLELKVVVRVGLRNG